MYPTSLLHINIVVVHTQQNQVTEIKGFRLELSVVFCISNCQHFPCSLHQTKKQEKRVNCLQKNPGAGTLVSYDTLNHSDHCYQNMNMKEFL